MTSSAIRQSFLDFFKEKQHTIVPSSSLLPDSPNLLFTNAGMNQFVPIFLGQSVCPYQPARAADTQKCIRAGGKHNDLEDVGFDTYHHTFFEMLGNWSFGDYFKKEAITWAWELVVGRWNFPASRLYATIYCPNTDDWEKIIKEAIKVKGDYDAFKNSFQWIQHQGEEPGLEPHPDFEAACHWVKIFTQAGFDPEIHVVPGNKKDNFWMMGDTGPCGPCSELHVNLLPGPRDPDLESQKKGRELVNSGDARCIEIWNLVFIQFNADPRAEFPLVDLPARHVDTGMGFERVTSMIQGTKGLTDFSESGKISNYETDVFRPLFDELEKLTGHKYTSTLPGEENVKQQNFHLNISEDDYAVRMRRAEEALSKGFKVKLRLKFRGEEMPQQEAGMSLLRRMQSDLAKVGVVDKEIEAVGKDAWFVLSPLPTALQSRSEREKIDVAFRVIADHIRTLSFSIADGIQPGNEGRTYVLRRILRRAVSYGNNLGFRQPFLAKLVDVLGITMGHVFPEVVEKAELIKKTLTNEEESFFRTLERGNELFEGFAKSVELIRSGKFAENLGGSPYVTDPNMQFPGAEAFRLYDTYGFPLDLTELKARERGLTVNVSEFNRLMDEQKAKGKAAQKKEVITVEDISTSEGESLPKTKFFGYESANLKLHALVEGQTKPDDAKPSLALDRTPFYAAMGGQVSDIGVLEFEDQIYKIKDVTAQAGVYFHWLDKPFIGPLKSDVVLYVDEPRRHKIEAHHSGTHLLNWALRKVLGNTITQKGSYVGPDRLRFDFSHGAALTPEELAEVERLVNDQINANVGVDWAERPYAEVKGDPSILQFFGDKYGEIVRVVSIGYFSKELCGGTHVRRSGEIGYFKILSEGAIAAGIRRIEAASGSALIEHIRESLPKQDEHHTTLRLRKPDLAPLPAQPLAEDESPATFWKHWEDRMSALQAAAALVAHHEKEEGKRQEATFQKRAAETAPDLIGAVREVNGIPVLSVLVENAPAAYLPVLADALKSRWQGVAILAVVDQGKVALLCSVSPAFTKKIQAGKIIQAIAPLVGGKGGGRPELAQGGGANPDGVASALAKAEEFVRAI